LAPGTVYALKSVNADALVVTADFAVAVVFLLSFVAGLTSFRVASRSHRFPGSGAAIVPVGEIDVGSIGMPMSVRLPPGKYRALVTVCVCGTLMGTRTSA